MFHGAHLRMRRGTRPSTLHSFFGSVHSYRKQPFRRGVLFTTIAGVLMLTGGILTWLGFSDVLGSNRISTTGPLLIALALLLFLISIRQFLLAKKQTMQNRERLEALASEAIAAVVINGEEGDNTVTVIMDTFNATTPDPEVISPTGDGQPPSYVEATETPIDPGVPPDYHHTDPPPSYEEAMAEPATEDQNNSTIK